MQATANSEIFRRVEESLESIRPYLVADGGDIQIVSISPENAVKLKLLGNCADCSMSFMTMKAGVEDTIRKAVPEITTIETV
jgi:Fe-S cluster biogenesis protein NfuA